jgi:hypothetical protein
MPEREEQTLVRSGGASLKVTKVQVLRVFWAANELVLEYTQSGNA